MTLSLIPLRIVSILRRFPGPRMQAQKTGIEIVLRNGVLAVSTLGRHLYTCIKHKGFPTHDSSLELLRLSLSFLM